MSRPKRIPLSLEDLKRNIKVLNRPDVYIPDIAEDFKVIEGSEYKVSNFGNVISPRGEIVNRFILNKSYAVDIVVNGKRSKKAVHDLMMMSFKKDERFPKIKRGLFKGKMGRPSKKLASKGNYNIVFSKHAVPIDGNWLNLRLDNFKWADKSIKNEYYYNTGKKYANVFYTGDVLIKQIQNNTSDHNKKDNDIVIDFLRGNDSAIWNLFLKYNDVYKAVLKKYLNEHSKNDSKKRKESHLQLDDFIIEAQMKMINKIKKGRYCSIGGGFKSWSCHVIKHYFQRYLEIQRNKELKDKIDVFFD